MSWVGKIFRDLLFIVFILTFGFFVVNSRIGYNVKGVRIPSVLAQSLYSKACPNPSWSLWGGWQTVNPSTGSYLQWGCIDVYGDVMIGNILYPQSGATLSKLTSSLPAGGTIELTPGTYRITSLFFERPYELHGQGSTRTILQYASTSGAAIVENEAGNVSNQPFVGLSDLTLQGPGAGTPTVGLQLGASSDMNLDQLVIRDVKITGFGTGVKTSNASSGQVLHVSCDNCNLIGNGTAWIQSQGETMRLINSNISGNGTGLSLSGSGLSELDAANDSIDDNTVVGVLLAGNSIFRGTRIHFENSSGSTARYVRQRRGTSCFSLVDSTLQDDTKSGTLHEFVSSGGGNCLNLTDVTVWSAGQTVTEVANIEGAFNAGVHLELWNLSGSLITSLFADTSENRIDGAFYPLDSSSHPASRVFQWIGLDITGSALLTMGQTTVGELPPASLHPGAMILVTDSTAVQSEGQSCVGSSSDRAIAISNGSHWKCF